METTGRILVKGMIINTMFSSLLHLGAMGEQGASGNPGKDSIPHDIHILFVLWS